MVKPEEFPLNIKGLQNLDKLSVKERQIRFSLYKIQEKLLENAMTFDKYIATLADAPQSMNANAIIDTLLETVTKNKPSRDLKYKDDSLNKLLTEQKTLKLTGSEKVINCKEKLLEKAKEFNKQPLEAVLAIIDGELEKSVKEELTYIDKKLPLLTSEGKTSENSPLNDYIQDRLKTLKKKIEPDLVLSKKNRGSPHYTQLLRFNEELEYKAKTLTTGRPQEDINKEEDFKKNLYPECPIKITETMETNIRKSIDYHTWSTITDLQKFELLMLAKEPNSAIAAKKIDEAFIKYEGKKEENKPKPDLS
jgi:hypothetical protein